MRTFRRIRLFVRTTDMFCLYANGRLLGFCEVMRIVLPLLNKQLSRPVVAHTCYSYGTIARLLLTMVMVMNDNLISDGTFRVLFH